MAVCKFFQTNSCKFGSRCRNQHIYEHEPEETYDQPRKPSGVSVLQRNKYVANQPPRVDTEFGHHSQEVYRQVNPVNTVWVAPGYSYQPAHGNINQARYPGYGLSAIPTTVPSKSFYYEPQNTNQARHYYQASQNTGFSLGSHPAFRGHTQSAAFNTNIFGQAIGGNDGFNVSNGSTFMPDPFGQPLQPMIVPKVSVFGQPMEDNNAFTQNIFGGPVYTKSYTDSSITAAQASQSSSQFSVSNSNTEPYPSAKASNNSLMYTNVTDLTPEELEQFRATTFTYGRTPLNCPPREMC